MPIAHHIHNLKQKPEHVRQRIALGTAASVSGVVALLWLVALVAGGSLSLALPTSNVLASGQDADSQAPTTAPNFKDLVAGAAAAATGAATGTPALTIVDGGTSSTIHTATTTDSNSATILPF